MSNLSKVGCSISCLMVQGHSQIKSGNHESHLVPSAVISDSSSQNLLFLCYAHTPSSILLASNFDWPIVVPTLYSATYQSAIFGLFYSPVCFCNPSESVIVLELPLIIVQRRIGGVSVSPPQNVWWSTDQQDDTTGTCVLIVPNPKVET